MEQEILKKEYTLSATDIDCHGRFRLSALLNHMQNMATQHATILGFDRDYMMGEHNLFWMLVRSQLSLKRDIRFEETVTMHTWPRPITKGPIVFRDFDLFVSGEHVGEATMSWVLVDITSRNIIKPSTLARLQKTPEVQTPKTTAPGKVKLPEEMKTVFHRPVFYSDTDINGHMNNVRYVDIACDALAFEQRGEQYVSELLINYQKECFPGDQLEILTHAQGDEHFVTGRFATGQSSFDLSLTLATSEGEG